MQQKNSRMMYKMHKEKRKKHKKNEKTNKKKAPKDTYCPFNMSHLMLYF
jgi:hypothetical protein